MFINQILIIKLHPVMEKMQEHEKSCEVDFLPTKMFGENFLNYFPNLILNDQEVKADEFKDILVDDMKTQIDGVWKEHSIMRGIDRLGRTFICFKVKVTEEKDKEFLAVGTFYQRDIKFPKIVAYTSAWQYYPSNIIFYNAYVTANDIDLINSRLFKLIGGGKLKNFNLKNNLDTKAPDSFIGNGKSTIVLA